MSWLAFLFAHRQLPKTGSNKTTPLFLSPVNPFLALQIFFEPQVLTTNKPDLHPRASHPPSQLHLLHGSLFAIKCSNAPECSWTDPLNLSDPFCPALAAASEEAPPSPTAQIHPLLDPSRALPKIAASELPHCPECGTGLQRPGVVWFGESLDGAMLRAIYDWIQAEPVDMVLVVGTSSVVYPAAGFAEQARTKGRTSVVTVNLDAEKPATLAELKEGDFAFAGDAAEVLPRLLEPVIGEMREDGTFA